MLARRLTALLLILTLTAVVPAMAEAMPYRLTVDLTNNIVTAYSTKDGSIVRQMICSSGAAQTPTIQGTFTMPNKKRGTERKEWYTFVDGYGKWGTRISGNYLFHSYLFTRKDDEAVFWDSYVAMGTDASHGCIRLYIEDAKWISLNCLPGTKVKIYESGVHYNYLKELLFQESYSVDSGMTYEEYTAMAKDETELGYGSKGDEVALLQSRLISLGLYAGDRDGFYDEDLLRAVKAIQTVLGLPATGVVDQAFRLAIDAGDAPVSTLSTLREGMNSQPVRVLKALLKSLGLYEGAIDACFDADTREAVILFQRLMSEEETGIVTSTQITGMRRMISHLDSTYGEGMYAIKLEKKTVTNATVISNDVLNMREKKSTNSKSLAKIEPGTVVTVLKSNDAWTGIAYGDIMGYVMTEYLNIETIELVVPSYVKADATHPALEKADSNLTVIPTENVKYAAVKSGTILSVWESSSAEGAKLSFKLSPGTTVRVISPSGNWAFIAYGGKKGFAKLSQLNMGTITELSVGNSSDDTAIMEEDDETPYAYVTSDSAVNVYSQASESGKVIGELDAGERAEVILESASWTQVRIGDRTGYVPSGDVFVGTSAGIEAYLDDLAASSTRYAVVSTGSEARLNMRATASEGAEVSSTLENGTVVEVKSDDGTWCEIEYNWKTGYVMSRYVLDIDENQEAYDAEAAGYADYLIDDSMGEVADESLDETADGGN